MENNYFNLTSYVDGFEINYLLSPSYKTLSNEAYAFANSICEFCKITIRNRIKAAKKINNTVSIILYCDGVGVECPDYVCESYPSIMTDEEFEQKMFGLRLEIRKAIVDAVACSSKFTNQ